MNRNEVKHKPWLPPRPQAVIVAGLGVEGSLRPSDLVHTVRQAVFAWSRRIVEEREHVGEFYDLAATLIASGGTGVTAGQAATLIVQGVCQANELLKEQGTNNQRVWPRVSHLRLIEIYLDRASEAWRALKLQAIATPDRYELEDHIVPGIGPLQRPLDSGYPRRRLRFHHGRNPHAGERGKRDRLCARHQNGRVRKCARRPRRAGLSAT